MTEVNKVLVPFFGFSRRYMLEKKCVGRSQLIRIYNIMSDNTISNIKQNLFCLNPNHEKESLDYVCISDDGERAELLCYLCEEEKDQKSESKSIRILLHRIFDVEKFMHQSTRLTAQLDLLFYSIYTRLKATSSQYVNPTEIMTVFSTFAQQKKEQILNVFTLKKSLQGYKWNNPSEMQEFLTKLFLNNFQYLSLEEGNKTYNSPYQKVIKIISQQLEKIVESIQKLNKEGKLNDMEILSLFPLTTEIRRKFKVVFSQTMKGSCMKIINPLKAEMSTSGTQRVLILEPTLEGKSIKRWKVKITKLASWIGVGACHINKIKDANYNFNYNSTGHGSYFISSNGYSWSGYKPEYNSKFQPFSYKTDDIICVQFDPRDRLLKFKKQETDQTYKLDIQFISGDPVHPAINLTGIGDSVEIVQ